jgi:hypothetical protein
MARLAVFELVQYGLLLRDGPSPAATDRLCAVARGNWGGTLGSLLGRLRCLEGRPLILRPGGMGALILMCVVSEELGYDPREFFWVIERLGAAPWARLRLLR